MTTIYLTNNLAVIAQFSAYNERRYSRPWACEFTKGKYNFEKRVSTYIKTSDAGAGDLCIIEPQEGVVYAYGQKDYRGNRTELNFAIFENGEFRKLENKMEAIKLS